MNILLINKFLHPNGGSETYLFKLGQVLADHGHRVQYFGMDHPSRCVGNDVDAYTAYMDFHGGSLLAKLAYPVKTIYSGEARRKLRQVLEDFQPEVCHLNNFHYQLTPSILLEIRKWERQSGHKVKIILTAHDYQLVCPNHMLYDPRRAQNCEKCLGGHFLHCAKDGCIHGSRVKSIIGTLEALIWNRTGVYRQMDRILCCSEFLKSKLDTNPVFAEKTLVMRNFAEKKEESGLEKEDYVLYFGRYVQEKGVPLLMEACKALPEIPFVFAGSGPLEGDIEAVSNVTNLGFLTGEALDTWIRKARFSVCPSVMAENCPFSVIESLMLGTPVLGARTGGIPELIADRETGELFESGNGAELTEKIRKLWEDKQRAAAYSCNCKDISFDTVEQYYEKLMKLYGWRENNG